jgi:phage repressor protein C with HTH and peptisase S24 domain
MALTHKQIWNAIDGLAKNHDMSASGLAKAGGLDPTTFNKSKRIAPNGKERWPSTESISKILDATGASFDDFVRLASRGGRRGARAFRTVPLIGLAQAGNKGYFDDAGFPAGGGWDQIALPEISDEEHVYALEVTGDSMLPVYRDGDRIVVSPDANVRRGDRVVVKTNSGEVMVKQLNRMSAQRIELKSFNPSYQDRTFSQNDVAFIHRIVWASQ